MTKDEVITIISNTIENLTWNKLAMVVTVCGFAVLLAFGFENRAQIIDTLMVPAHSDAADEPWVLSPASRKELESLVDGQPLIGGALIWDVDLKKNRATSTFLYPREKILKGVTTDLSLPQAFFDSEPKSRAQIISVINNSFTCSPTEDVTFVMLLSPKFPTTCFLAIPPYTGGFVGFAGLVLSRRPTVNERDTLRIELTRIAISIYLRDIEYKRPKLKNPGVFGS